MTSVTHKTTFMVISDTHNLEMEAAAAGGFPISLPHPRVDVLLHCGDLTQVGGISAYKKALKLLSHLDAELKLVIAGNHDISLDAQYWHTHLEEDDDPEEHDQAVEIMTGKLAKEAGVTYLTEGTRSFTLENGATFSLYASPYQPECGEWAFGYSHKEDRWSSKPAPGRTSIAENPMPANVDIVMTHGPPREILDLVPDPFDPTTKQPAGCAALRHAIERTRPLMHCFGHIHDGYGVEMKEWAATLPQEPVVAASVSTAQADTPTDVSLVRSKRTLMVNAAIMDGRSKPSNAPWVVSLELPDST